MSKRHIHKYHKVRVNGIEVWACALPDCNHHMPKHYEDMIPGKSSICWSCGEQMILDSDNMRLEKPSCFSCLHPEFSSEDGVFNKVDIMDQLIKGRE